VRSGGPGGRPTATLTTASSRGARVAYLQMAGLHKRYGGVVALNDANLACERGEVHALLGPNGSGKSTVNKILTGVVAPDAGTITIAGRRVTIDGPAAAQRHRIAAVYQDLSLVDDLTVADNIALAVEPTRAGFVSRAEVRRRAEEALAPFAEAFDRRELPVERRVSELSAGDQQLVEIAKALARKPEILVLDEATASLRAAQVEVLFDVVRRLRDDGVLIVFVSHRLEEIMELCDRATILRNGRDVATVERAETSEAELVRLMIGEIETHERERRPEPDAEVVLRVTDLRTSRLNGATFELRRGEVLGLGGLQGQGQSELLMALFGADRILGGTVELGGRPLRLTSPRAAMRAGFAYVPGDRGREGILTGRPILENLTLPSLNRRSRGGFLPHRDERAAANRVVEQLAIKLGDLEDSVGSLSGGNQQKVVVGKWLLTEPRIVLLDDPTKGIDVGAKQELFTLIDALTAQGVSVLFNSSEDRELLAMCDRILVLYEGRVVDVLAGDRLTEEALLAATLRIEEVQA